MRVNWEWQEIPEGDSLYPKIGNVARLEWIALWEWATHLPAEGMLETSLEKVNPIFRVELVCEINLGLQVNISKYSIGKMLWDLK